MINKKSKRGTHVGVVISFVIFVTFIVFLYIAIQPKIRSASKENLLENMKNGVMSMASINITSVSVLLDRNNVASCVKLDDFFTEAGMGGKILVSDQAGNVLSDVRKDGSDLVITRGVNIFFINTHESSDFSTIGTVSSPCVTSEYSLGLVKTRNGILESRIVGLIENYTDDQEALGLNLGIPEGNGFSFGLTYNNGTMIKTPDVNVSISVFSDDVLIRYVNNKGFEESGVLNVKVW